MARHQRQSPLMRPPRASRDADKYVLAHRAWTTLVADSSLVRDDGCFIISVGIPRGKPIAATGHSLEEARAEFCGLVAGFVERESYEELAELVKARQSVEGVRVSSTIKTKERQKSIGIYSGRPLLECVDKDAPGQRAQRARDLFARGFAELDHRLDDESSIAVLNSFEESLRSFSGSESVQWMLYLDKKTYGRAIIRAGEYGKSASNLAGMCIAYALKELG